VIVWDMSADACGTVSMLQHTCCTYTAQLM